MKKRRIYFEEATSKRMRDGEKEQISQELAKTEAEVDVEQEQYLCIVHKGKIVGSVYLYPNCYSFYCIKRARALKEKQEKCWSCNSEILIK